MFLAMLGPFWAMFNMDSKIFKAFLGAPTRHVAPLHRPRPGAHALPALVSGPRPRPTVCSLGAASDGAPRPFRSSVRQYASHGRWARRVGKLVSAVLAEQPALCGPSMP